MATTERTPITEKAVARAEQFAAVPKQEKKTGGVGYVKGYPTVSRLWNQEPCGDRETCRCDEHY